MNAIAATVASTVDRTTIRLQLIGDVQGFGIRPLIASLASQHDLVGSVRNCRQGVDIVITGSQTTVDQFREALQVRIPLAKQLVLANCELEPSDRFAILDSIADGVVQFAIPRDRIICEECVQEIQTPSNRRFGYALNGCAQCGPRYSIISAMPYDRKHTSMEGFTMCGDCQTEFDDPVHRRFHAQTNCCSKCGPNVWYEESCDCIEDSATAIKSAAHAILQGRILALKGLGGYQLVCDATNQKAVEKLRLRKQRRTKPFAVMVASVQDASVIAELNNQNAEALRGPAGPIVILQPKPNSGLAPNIHAGFGSVGLMLPTTALHVLLLNATQKNLVVTSGNLEGEPQEYREVEAARNLRSIADCFLHHNRPIINPIDDSVVQSMAGNLVTLRPARGLTPMQINYQTSLQILALGGQQKSAVVRK